MDDSDDEEVCKAKCVGKAQPSGGFNNLSGVATLQENFSQNWDLFMRQLFPRSYPGIFLEVKLARKEFWFISCRDAC